VHLNDSPLLPAAQLAHRRAKVVWHLRSALAHGGTDARSRAIRQLMNRWGDAAIAIDQDVARHFPLRLSSTIVFNAVDRRPGPDSMEAKATLGLPPDRIAVGFAGFIRRQKGWPELVRAARLVVDEEPKVQFVIIGGGVRPQDYFRTTRGRLLARLQLLSDDETAMRNLVDQMDLAEHFSFLPFTSDTSTAYRAVDIVTFPNQGVGLGRPVLEAAAYAKPVVASGSLQGGGVLIPDETGLLLQDPTPQAVAESILRLVHDGGLRERLGSAAAEHARLAFDPTQNARLVQDFYDGLLGIAPPTSARRVSRDTASVAAG
jgi:glycosyltransferase involved in cell wall biosynthesis